MGLCPCPRCLIPKTCAHQVGTKSDKRRRKKLARVDNLQYQAKISSARDIIYQQLRGVDSTFVQDILKPESLVPTKVSFPTALHCYYIYWLKSTECILGEAFAVWVQHIWNISCRLHARIWAWCLEENFHAPAQNLGVHQGSSKYNGSAVNSFSLTILLNSHLPLLDSVKSPVSAVIL